VVRIIVIPFLILRYKFKLRYKIKLKHYKNGFYTSNHQSLVDPPLIGIFSPKTLFFVAKKELFKNIIIGFFLKIAGALPINRAVFDKKTLFKIIGLIKDNYSVLMFPEGTRSRGNRFLNAKPGIGYLVKEANFPSIIPVKIWNSKNALDNILKLKRPEIILTYGRPFCINKYYNWGKKGSEKYRNISRYILERIKKV
jgi:1-acyl-sn-glycerol-3-phosphate acyltransferase